MLPSPLDQGAQCTCIALAFTQVCTSMLRLKYAITIPPATMAAVVKDRCGCWAGSHVETVCAEWNAAQPAMEDSSQQNVFRFHVVCRELTFIEAVEVVQKFRSTPSAIVVVPGVYNRHALSAFDTVPQRSQIVGINSYGPTSMFVYVGQQEFITAFLLDPEIFHVQQMQTVLTPPALTTLYRSKLDTQNDSCVILTVEAPGGQLLQFNVNLNDLVRTLKGRIFLQLGILEGEQLLTFSGVSLEDGQMLGKYGIGHWSSLQLDVLNVDDVDPPQEAPTAETSLDGERIQAPPCHEDEIEMVIQDVDSFFVGQATRSHVRSAGGFEFCLLVFPGGTASTQGEQAGAFVEAAGPLKSLNLAARQDIIYQITIVNQQDFSRSITRLCKWSVTPADTNDRGWHSMIPVAKLLEEPGWLGPGLYERSLCIRASCYTYREEAAFHKGECVQAKHRDGLWYFAVIAFENGNRTYTVTWREEDDEDRIKFHHEVMEPQQGLDPPAENEIDFLVGKASSYEVSERAISHLCCNRGFCFRLLVFPTGTALAQPNHMSVFIEFDSLRSSRPDAGPFWVQCQITIVNRNNCYESFTKQALWRFSGTEIECGWHDMISTFELNRESGLVGEHDSIRFRAVCTPQDHAQPS